MIITPRFAVLLIVFITLLWWRIKFSLTYEVYINYDVRKNIISFIIHFYKLKYFTFKIAIKRVRMTNEILKQKKTIIYTS